MEGGESNGKRASAEEVKSEPEEGEVLMMLQDGGEGGGALVAAESMAPAQIDVRMDLTLLHCQGCLLPLKPPVFKVIPSFPSPPESDHRFFWKKSIARPPGTSCATTAAPSTARSAAAPARTAASWTPWWAPPRCRAPTGRSAASGTSCTTRPRTTSARATARPAPARTRRAHSRAPARRSLPLRGRPPAPRRHGPATGRARDLGLSVSGCWHALVGERRQRVLVSLGPLGAAILGPLGAATAVSLVCVRPDGEAAPQVWCKLSVERLGGDNRDRLVLMASAVSSSALSTGAPAPGQGMFLAVPQELLSGDTLTLTVRIDLIRPAAAAAAPKSTTPQPRTARRMQ
uniref:Uncharacterized protein n=1 Tax=Aegilops tauschii TaxID=37682 RepID=M8CMT3_AEGTA